MAVTERVVWPPVPMERVVTPPVKVGWAVMTGSAGWKTTLTRLSVAEEVKALPLQRSAKESKVVLMEDVSVAWAW